MKVSEIMEKRAAFSFEVFPPKTDRGMEKLCGENGVLDHLYALHPDYISCTYGAGGDERRRNLDVLSKYQDRRQMHARDAFYLHWQYPRGHQGAAAEVSGPRY